MFSASQNGPYRYQILIFELKWRHPKSGPGNPQIGPNEFESRELPPNEIEHDGSESDGSESNTSERGEPRPDSFGLGNKIQWSCCFEHFIDPEKSYSKVTIINESSFSRKEPSMCGAVLYCNNKFKYVDYNPLAPGNGTAHWNCLGFAFDSRPDSLTWNVRRDLTGSAFKVVPEIANITIPNPLLTNWFRLLFAGTIHDPHYRQQYPLEQHSTETPYITQEPENLQEDNGISHKQREDNRISHKQRQMCLSGDPAYIWALAAFYFDREGRSLKLQKYFSSEERHVSLEANVAKSPGTTIVVQVYPITNAPKRILLF